MGQRQKEEFIEREVKWHIEAFKTESPKKWQIMPISEREKFEQDLRERISKSFKSKPYYLKASLFAFLVLILFSNLFRSILNSFGSDTYLFLFIILSTIGSVYFWHAVNSYILFEKEQERREIKKLIIIEFFIVLVPNVWYYTPAFFPYWHSLLDTTNLNPLFEISIILFTFISIGFIPEFLIRLLSLFRPKKNKFGSNKNEEVNS